MPSFKRLKEKTFHVAGEVLEEALRTSWELLKITIPVVIVTKILEELGMITLLSEYLEPVMGLIGLPGSMGLVWATAMLTNLYGAVVVFANLAGELHLTVAQVTVVCSAMLIAHSLPLELAISKKAGAPFMPIALLRLFGAFIYGYLLHMLCSSLQLWQDTATVFFQAGQKPATLLLWAVGQLKNFGLIIFVIFCIVIIMKILRVTGVLGFLEKMLEPVLPLFGMSKKAAPVTVVGMVMGISYGGALIIRETNSGTMAKREVFFSLALMGLSHSLVEDTLLMVALGGHWGGLLIGRVLFSLVVIYLLALFTAGRKRQATVS
ncbi:MAG: nucleoside recognition domain-containing protein [Desulfopila sp.]